MKITFSLFIFILTSVIYGQNPIALTKQTSIIEGIAKDKREKRTINNAILVKKSATNSPTGNITSLSDYNFIGTGYHYLTAPSTPLNSNLSFNGTQVAYVPDLTGLSKLETVYISENGNGNGSSESNPTSLKNVLSNGAQNKVIIAANGNYFAKGIALNNINNVHLIAKNKGKAIIKSSNTNNFNLANSNVTISNFSIIGFKAEGDNNYFIFGPGNGLNYNAYNIYFSDMEWSNYSCVIYSGLHSHDWTIDKSLYHSSTHEYIWYMMGWHHTLMNTVMYNDPYMAMAIRGSYPPDEEYFYDQHGQTQIADRKKHFLTDNDWTHMVINNTFGSNNLDIGEHVRDIHMSVWSDTPSDEKGLTEDVYFPPKNIIISNNAFIDNGFKNKMPILFASSRGVNDSDPTNAAAINGVIIKNNYTDNSTLIDPYGSTDISSVNLTSNVLNFTNFGFDDKNREYTISASSGLINKGTTSIYFPNVDNAGNYRDHMPDVGAYEFSSVLSVEVPNLTKFGIYPNPSNGVVHIKLDTFTKDINISITNMFGQTIKAINYKDTQTIEADLSELTSGIYYLNINTNNLTDSHKLIISK